jgi:hypothetical protein
VEDLIRYLEEIVEPTIADFERNPTSVRHAFLACVATCHAVDYLAHARSPANLRHKLKKASWEFELVDEVAHAFKHVVSGARGKPRIRAKSVVRQEGGLLPDTHLRRGFDVPRVTIAGYPKIDLLGYVKTAAQFIREHGSGAPAIHGAPSAPRSHRQPGAGGH